MAGNGDNRELRRLRRVYRLYDHLAVNKWHPGNVGNQIMLRERRAAVEELLREGGLLPLGDRRILEVGCGYGGVLAEMLEWGAQPGNLYGVDLVPGRVEAARQRYPQFNFYCANAEELAWDDGAFDMVLLFTVFSSILDNKMACSVAREVKRVLRPGGCILWYDFRYHNPFNRHVRGISRRRLRDLFPGFRCRTRLVTLLPPLARRLGTLTPVLYPLFSRVGLLRTHYLALLVKS